MTRRGWLLFAVMCLLWGIPYLLIKIAVAEVSVPVVVFCRTVLGALVLLPLAVRPGLVAVLRAHRLPLLGFALLEIIGPWALLSDAEKRLPSSLTGLLIAAVPVLAVLVERATGGSERITRTRTFGLALGFAGVAVLAAPGLTGGTTWPVVEVLLVAVGYAVAPVLAARRLGAVPGLAMTAACLTVAALVYAVPAALTWPDRSPGAAAVASLVALGLLCTALAFVVFFALIREVGPARGLTFTYVNPAVAVAAGVLLLDEPLTVSAVLAFGLILVGCGLATGTSRVGTDPVGRTDGCATLGPGSGRPEEGVR